MYDERGEGLKGKKNIEHKIKITLNCYTNFFIVLIFQEKKNAFIFENFQRTTLSCKIAVGFFY
jgi:hypothetical protein